MERVPAAGVAISQVRQPSFFLFVAIWTAKF